MTLPRQNSAWVDGDGRPTRDLYNWARSINVTPQTGVASSYSLGDLTNVSLSGISDGDVLTWSNTQGKWVNSAASSSGYAEGTAFPSSPTTGDKFYRTDLNWLCFYDGTRWLTCHENEFTFVFTGSMPTNNSTGITVLRGAMPGDYAAYVTRMDLAIETGGGVHDAMNYVIVDTYTLGTSNTTSVPLASINTSSGIALNTCERFDSVINTACPITDKRLIVLISHNGSTPNTTIYANVFYRKIVT